MLKTVWIVFSCLYLFSCRENKKDTLPYYNSADFTPLFISPQKAQLQVRHQVENFIFSDQTNTDFDSKQLDGKIHVANFFFTGCGSICPPMMKKLARVQKQFEFEEEIVFLSFSVTPWSDSVPRLREYAELNEIDSKKWKLLTGNRTDIYRVARKSYFAEESLGFSKDSTNFLHTEHVLLVDRSKRIRGIYNGTLQLDMDQLAADIEKLKKENF